MLSTQKVFMYFLLQFRKMLKLYLIPADNIVLFTFAAIPMVNLFLIILGPMHTTILGQDIIQSCNVVYLLLQ